MSKPVNVTEEVRRDVVGHLTDMRASFEGLPVHQFVLVEIIDAVKRAELTPCFEHV